MVIIGRHVASCKEAGRLRDTVPVMRTTSLRWIVPLTLLLVASASPVSAKVGEDSAATNFALAKLLADEGDFAQATVLFERAVAAEPSDATLRVEFADFLFRVSRADDALAQINVARALTPGDPTVLRMFGQISLAGAGEHPGAVVRALEALEQLREVEPSDLMGMVTLAQAYDGSGRVSEAADVLEALVGYHNDNERLKRYWIDLLTRAGRNAEATEVLREVVRLEQESIESRIELAQREATDGNFSAAIELLDQVRELRDSPEVIKFLAQALMERSQSPGLSSEQRQVDLDRAQSLASELPADDALGLKGRVLALMDQRGEAISLLEGSVAKGSISLANRMLLARLYEGNGQVDQARATLMAAVSQAKGEEKLPAQRELIGFLVRRQDWLGVLASIDAVLDGTKSDQFPGLRALRIDALTQLGRHADALKVLRSDGGRTPSPENLMARAEVLADQGKERDTREMLARVTSTDPSVLQRKADVLIQLGDIDAAVAIVDDLVDETAVGGLLAAGQFLSRAGAFDRAQGYLEKALSAPEVKSNDRMRADVEFLLGQALERQGQVDQAAAHFRRVLEIRSDDSMALNYLGYMLADAGRDLEEALDLIERAVELDPDNGAYQDSLGWAHYRLGNYREATEALIRASVLSPGNATIFDHLGDAYRALGRTDEARQAYEQALSIAQDSAAGAQNDVEGERVREKLALLRRSQGPQ